MAGGFVPVERPPGAIDIEDLAQADCALGRALEHGDYGPLLECLRAGKGSPVEQKLLADIYQGKVKRPANSPSDGTRNCCGSYSITSSARCRNDSGIARPSVLAVLRLTTS